MRGIELYKIQLQGEYMNWEQVMMDKLKKYPYQLDAVVNIQNKIEFLNSDMYSLKSVMRDTEPVQGGGNKQEDVLIARVMEKTLLENNLKFVKYEINEIERAVDILDKDEKEVITLFYLQKYRMSVERMIDKLHCSKNTLYRTRNAAIRKMVLFLYGKIEIE